MTQQNTNSTYHRQTNQTENANQVDANSVEFISGNPPDLSTNAKRIWIDQITEKLSYTVDGVAIRTLQQDLEIISVKNHGAIGDGVTNDTSAINSAVTAALASNALLYWESGTYLTTSSIANFHSVRHSGTGVVKRGTDLFYPNIWLDTQTNRIYVSTTGSNANDGLSAAQPMLTFQKAFDSLKVYGAPSLSGNWQIIAAAGTYTVIGQQTHSVPSKNRVLIRGAAVGGHPNVPTTIIDGTGGTDYDHGLSASGIGVRVEFRDLKFQNFVSGNNRIGCVGENESDFYTNNVHANNCDWTGIYAFNTVRARISGGILNACRSGFIANATECTIGYGASSNAQGTTVTNCTESGIYWSRGSQGHIDYCNVNDNAVGVVIAENSRADTISIDFKRNIVGLRIRTGGIYGEGGALNTFNNGTADANTTNIEYKAFSGDTTELTFSETYTRVAYDRITRTASGTTPTTLTTPYTIKAYRMQGTGKQCRVHVLGVFTTVTAASTLTVNFGGMAFILTVPNAGSGLTFEIDVTLMEVQGGYRSIGKLLQGLNGVRVATSGTGFSNSTDQNISVACSLSGAGDAITIYRTDVYLMG